MRLRIATLALVLSGSAGCSALGLASFDIAQCNDSADCSAINNRNRVPEDACERFVCEFPRNAMGQPIAGAAGSCVRGIRDDDADGAINPACAREGLLVDCNDGDPTVRSGSAEVCDGADNDCDGVIDDGAAAPLSHARVIASALAGPVFTPDLGVLVAGAPGARVIGAVPTAGVIMSAPVTYRMHTPPTDAEARVCTPRRSGTISQGMLVAGCPNYRAGALPGEPPVTAGSCEMAETELAPSRGALMMAAVNRSGCIAGQLRIGLMPSIAAGGVELRGPIGRSNLWLGVDLGPDGCTGAGASRGVHGLSFEGVPADPDRALAVFLGAGSDRACGAGPAPVRILGVARQPASAGATSIEVLNGSSSGVPQTLAMSTARPGTTPALSGDAVLVAHAETDGSIVVSRVSPSFPLPRVHTLADEGADACVVNELVVTPALSPPTTEWSLAAAGSIEAVDVAARAAGADEEIAVTYQIGCGGSAEIWFAMRNAAGTSSTAVRLGVGTDPQIVAVDRLVTTSFSRAGRTANAETLGGYAVAYRSGSAFHVVRIAALDGQVLTDTDESASGSDYHLSPTGIGWGDAGTVRVGDFICEPATPSP